MFGFLKPGFKKITFGEGDRGGGGGGGRVQPEGIMASAEGQAAARAATSPQPQSFGEAFAQARRQQGAGGTFEYGGRQYSTNIAGESGTRATGGAPAAAAGGARQAMPYLDEELTFNQAMRQARAEQGREGTFEYGGQTFRASYGQDYDGDGRITAGERMRDMTDGGGPGNSGGPFIGGGIISTIGNVATGQFGYDMDGDGRISARERAIDMTDGGGAGRAGSRFVGGGTLGAIGNVLGGPQPREGAVPGIGAPAAPAAPTVATPMAPMTSPAPMQNPMTVDTLGQPVPMQPGMQPSMDPAMNPMIYAQGPRVTVPLVGQPGLPSLIPGMIGMA